MHPLLLLSGLILIGDSITQGSVAGGGTCYATLLSEVFAIENRAVGATNTADWLATPSLTENADSDPVVIMLGTVDAVGKFGGGPPIEVPDFTVNIQQLVLRVLSNGAPYVVVVVPPPLQADAGLPIASARLEGYRTSILGLCGYSPEDPIRCGPDLLRDMDPRFDFNADDLFHPNAQGHAKIASLLLGSGALTIPEPSTGLLVIAGLLGLAYRQRRHRRAA